MKAIVPFLVAAIAGLAAAAAAGASAPTYAASSTPPCIPKPTISDGHVVVAYCGPATATLTIGGKTVGGKTVGGKTYTFKDGYCATDTANDFPLKITLGVIDSAKSPVNGGDPLFELNDLKTSGLTLQTVNADFGGKVLSNVGSVKLSGSIPEHGTFTSAGSTKPSFSGTWNCDNVVVAQP